MIWVPVRVLPICLVAIFSKLSRVKRFYCDDSDSGYKLHSSHLRRSLPGGNKTPAQVACFYTSLNPKTFSSISKYAPDAAFLSTAGSDYAYARELKKYWDGERDLITIEGDVEIDETFEQFRNCKRFWCSYSYQGPPHCGYLFRSMGCTKYSARLQRMVPFSQWDCGNLKWHHIDVELGHALSPFVPHIHGHLEHYHDYRTEYGFDNLKEHEVGWHVYWHDGKAIPACKELRPDKRVWLYEMDPATGRRGRFIKELPKGHPYMYGLEIFV